MPQVNIDGLTVDVDDVATAKVINDALKASTARADAAEKQVELFQKEDAKIPPEFLANIKKKKGEGEDDDKAKKKDADALTDEDTRSAHDAEMDTLRSERDALQGQLDAMTADAGHEEDGDEDDDANKDKKDSREDSADRQAWFQERQELVAVATSLRLDSFEKLKNPELKRAIVAEHTGKDVSKFSAERIDGAMPHIIEKVAARQDDLDRAAKALLPKTPEQRTDAQGNYRSGLVNAWKRTS